MKQKQKPRPPYYRLTLTQEAFRAALVAKCKWLNPVLCALRSDGKFDVAITHGLLDQLQTAALPKENLSDTVLRIMS